ncbi:MAG: GTPase domain-containing protein [Verrucomicrobiae bacterium]|nr:GTPase domain-containing protein [Verrucomicrobiae bacterium]
MRLNHATKQIQIKLVYCGAARSGKTANLEYLHGHADQAAGDTLESIKDSQDRTLLFDFAPFDLPKVNGYDVHCQIFTLPGNMRMETPGDLAFSGLDGLVLVVDSGWEQLESNLQYLEDLQASLFAHGLRLASLPHVLQYNKRDLENPIPLPHLNYLFNREGASAFEACAIDGEGVFEALNGLARLVLNRVLVEHFNAIPEELKVW